MADQNQQIMDMVAAELDADPNASLDTLFAKAGEIDPAVNELSKRQFHARYPLQVKRKRSAGAPRKSRGGAKKRRRAAPAQQSSAPATGRRRGSSGGGSDREKLRSLFMEFATEVAAAESRQDIFRVIGTVDAYVDRASKLDPR